MLRLVVTMHFPYRLLPRLTESGLGIVCAVTVISISMFLKSISGISYEQITYELFTQPYARLNGVLWFSSLAVSPLVEGLLFPLLWLFVSKVSSKRVAVASYLLIVTLVAFVLHGMSRAAISRAVGFAELGSLFAYRRLRGEKGYRAVVVAHFFWNLASLLLILWVGGSLAHR